MKYVPHKYQDYAIGRILEDETILLFLEMGLGKTVITLTAIEQLLNNMFEAEKVLIIAPLRVAQDTWSRESGKWDHTQHLRISKILGTARQREKALKADADIYVINRENVPWLVTYLGRKWPFDTVVADELSSFKNSKSQRFRALKRVRPFIKRFVGLTGTPAPNGLEDLWAPVYLADQGERLGKTITYFRERYFNAAPNYAAQNPHAMKYTAKPESENNIYQAISDIAVSMKAEDWLELPPRIDRIVPVVLDAKARAKYDELERHLLLSLPEGDVVASTAAVLSNKLLQMANGAVYNEHKLAQHIHDAKLDALEDIIEAANGKPVLLFYSFKHDLARIKKRFPFVRELRKGTAGNDDIADWNAGKIPLLAVHPASAGHGLNMQEAHGACCVWFGMTWSSELYDQANARVYRQGVQHTVVIYHLVVEDSMDEDVVKALADKRANQEQLMQAVKARIERVKGK